MNDLRPERDSIASIITEAGHIPVRAEKFRNWENSPIDVIRKEIDKCDCMIVLFHKRWGTIREIDNPKKLSITALEYTIARELGMQILVLKSSEEKESELKDFLYEIGEFESGQWINEYKDKEELVRIVSLSISDLTSYPSEKEKEKRFSHAIYHSSSDLSIRYDKDSDKWFLISDYEDDVELVLPTDYISYSKDIVSNLSNNKIVLIIGPHGTGKSILSRFALSLEIIEGKSVLDVGKLSENDIIEGLKIAKRKDFLTFYDPYGPEIYGDRKEIDVFNLTHRNNIVNVVKNINNFQNYSIIVLPSDIWNNIKDNLCRNLDETRIDIVTKKEIFFKQIINAYSNSHDKDNEALNLLTRLLMNYSDGYLLIAAYVGRWLKYNNYQIKSIEEVLKNAKGKSVQFFQYYIWSVILERGKDFKLIYDFSLPLIIHVIFGEVTPYVSKEAPLSLSGEYRSLNPEIAKWIAIEHEYLMEEGLQTLLLDATKQLEESNQELSTPKELRVVIDIIRETMMNISQSGRYDYGSFFGELLTHIQKWIVLRLDLNNNNILATQLVELYIRTIIADIKNIHLSLKIKQFFFNGNRIPSGCIIFYLE